MDKTIIGNSFKYKNMENNLDRYSKNIYKILIFLVTIFPIIYVPSKIVNIFAMLYFIKYIGFIIITLWMVFYYLKYRKSLNLIIGNNFKYIKLLFYTMSIFIVLSLISSLLARFKLFSLLGTPHYYIGSLFYVVSFIFFFVVTISFSQINTKKLLKYAYWGFSILGVVIHVQYFIGDIVYREGVKYNIGFFAGLGNRNFAVHPFAYLFLICFIQIITERDRLKQYKLLIPLMIFYSTILISLTRGSWVALAITMVFFISYTFLKERRLLFEKKKILAIILILLVIIFMVDNIFGDWSVYKRFPRTTSPLENIDEKGLEEALNQASSKRIVIWKAGISLLENNPKGWIIGIGPSTFYHYSDDYEYVFPKPFGSIHNEYLEILVTMGLLGLIIYSVWLLLVFYYGYYITKKDYSNFALWLIIVYFCISSLFISIHSVNFVYILVIFAYIINKYVILRRGEDK